MTTIIGIEHQHGCTIASDGQITTYDNTGISLQKQHLPTQHINKICNHPGYIFATAGDLRALNLIQHALKPTPPPKNPNKTLHHIINTLIPEIQQTYETHQYRHNNTNQTPETSSTILIAANGQIFTLDDDYAIGKDNLGIYALGTGAHYAIGALHALQPAQYVNNPQEIEKLVHHVYNIVNHHDPNTGPPYTIQHQTPPKNPKKTGNQHP